MLSSVDTGLHARCVHGRCHGRVHEERKRLVALARLRRALEESGLGQTLWIALLVLIIFFMGVRFAPAAPLLVDTMPTIAKPESVLVSYTGATVLVRQEVDVTNGTISLLLPGRARDLTLDVDPGVARWHSTVVRVPGHGAQDRVRTKLEGRARKLEAGILYASALLRHTDLDRTELSEAAETLAAHKEELARVKADLERLPKEEREALLVEARLVRKAPKDKVVATYSYRLPTVTWQPRYRADCVPGRDGKGRITVRLEAEIRQPEGLDWYDASLALVAGGDMGDVPPLRQWILGDRPLEVRPLARNAKAAAPMMAAAGSPDVVTVETDGPFTVWRPRLRGLAQGTSRVLLAEAVWEEKLVWLARPLNGDARVFLTASHTLAPAERHWPDGPLDASVLSVHRGTGAFDPREGRIELTFGLDPDVVVETSATPRRTGTEGIVESRRTWEWEWRYTLRNNRDGAVFLRVERPLPRTVDKDFRVEWTASPVADRVDNAVVWEVPLAADSTAELVHTVRATGPADTKFAPVAP